MTTPLATPSRCWVAAAVTAALWVLAGCASGPPAVLATSAAGPSTASHPLSSAPPGGSGPGRYTNPVYAGDFPDPALLRTGTHFVAYATQGDGANIQTQTSGDLIHWTKGPDALPTLPKWTTGDTWAPEVQKIAAHYVMFYVAKDVTSGRQCIGRATATTPTGPFNDPGTAPFMCQPDLGGSIDPDLFHAPDGRWFLYWKNDGNCCGQPTHLYGQQLSPDASRLTGRRRSLLGVDQPWQGQLVEAPEMLAHAHQFLLFYSANDYASDKYAIGYATCTGPLGPCHDASPSPWLHSTAAAAGPGHCFPFTLPDGSTWLLFHAWPPDAIGSQSPGRQLWLARVTFSGAVPVIAAPSNHALPTPITH